MSFLLLNGTFWAPAKWVSMGFFSDCTDHLAEAPNLADDIRFSIDAEVETIDLRDANAEKLQELRTHVQKVLADNLASRGSKFHQRDYFPVYLQHLQKLDALVNDAIRESKY